MLGKQLEWSAGHVEPGRLVVDDLQRVLVERWQRTVAGCLQLRCSPWRSAHPRPITRRPGSLGAAHAQTNPGGSERADHGADKLFPCRMSHLSRWSRRRMVEETG